MSKLTAIYYPDCYPTNRSVFAGMCLYFEEVHFVSASLDARSKEQYTQYLKDLPSTGVTINVFGDVQSEAAKRQLHRTTSFFAFVLDAKPMLGDVIHFHPSLTAREVNRVSSALLDGGLRREEWERFALRESDEARLVAAFALEHPEVDDEVLARLLPTARDLAAAHGYIPVSDNPSLPVPAIVEGAQLAETLAAAEALAILRLTLPCPLWTNAEEILELRHLLADEITSFRLMTLRLAGRLRATLKSEASLRDLQAEADFLAKTEVQPYVAEIRRRVDLEKGKTWRRLFGTAVKWVTLGIGSYTDPTGAVLLKAMKEAGDDLVSLSETAKGISVARDPGISFLFKLQEHREQRDGGV